MGLGLYITREIIHRHGGCMWLESQEGVGSLFGVALPLAQDELAASDGAQPAETITPVSESAS
jgi:signal transduction histidine kinase